MGGFFGPRPTPYDAGDRLSQLMQQRGQISSRAAEQSGQIWGNVVGGVGQALSQGVQQYGEDKKVREAEAKKQEQAGQMAKRDAAWVDYVNGGEWSKDPKQAYQTAMKVWGPKEGPVQFQALQSASTLMGPKRDPEKDMKAAGSIGGVLDKSPEPVRAKLYPGARTVLQNAFPDLALGEQYTTKEWDEVVRPLLAALPGEKPKGPMEVSQGASLVDPETGKVVYAGQPKAEAGFSLGPGDVRYDASGKAIASRPAAPKAREEGPLVAIMGPDGNPVLVPRSQAAGKRPASTREQGRPVTSGDAGRMADIDTALSDLTTLRSTLENAGDTGTLARIGAAMPNAVTEFSGWGSDAKQKQATIDRVKQVIGKTLEGGVLRKEDEIKYAKILPTIGDPADLVKAKLDGLEKAIGQRRGITLSSLEDAGYDVGKYAARGAAGQPSGDIAQPKSQGEYDALPKGTVYVGSDGRKRRK